MDAMTILNRAMRVIATVVAAMTFATAAHAADLSISGGTAVDSIPQGNSGNSVVAQAGIEFAGGHLWVNGSLDILGDAVTLTLYDVGSESYAVNQIRLANTSGLALADTDNFYKGGTGNFTNGRLPGERVGSVTQGAGIAGIEFWRTESNPSILAVVNGQSPMMLPSGSGYASIALAYLSDTYQIVSEPTNRILVLLEDSGGDSDFDDYVGILEIASTTPPPPPPPTQLTVLSISGGTAVDTIPQGSSGNTVLPQLGIGLAGGQVWVDGTLDMLGNQVTLTLYDVGSESHWHNMIRLTNSSGSVLLDTDDHWRGSTGDFTHGPLPGQRVGSLALSAGVANMEFWRIDSDPDVMIVVNGQSPMMMVEGYGYASIALAYLNETYQIVSGPTNRILVLLEDGGLDRDYDDYVGILEGPSIATVSVPNVVGLTESAATTAITNAGLVVGAVTEQSNATVPAGTVISQNPSAATNVAAGSAVDMVVSTGPTLAYDLSPTSIEFGDQAVNVLSTTRSITLRNTGSSDLSITSIALTGTNPGEFALGHNCGSSVPLNGSCAIAVAFKPTSTGSKTAIFAVTPGGGAATKNVSLSGAGVMPTVTVPNVVGLTELAATTTIVNAELVVGTVTRQSSATVPAGSVIIQNPSAATNAALGSAVGLVVSTGPALAYDLSATSIEFGSQPLNEVSAKRTITLRNTGGSDLPITSIALTGSNPSEFLLGHNCGSLVALNGSCAITITFRPISAGSKTANVTVTPGGGAAIKNVSLSGMGVKSIYSVSPAALAFGNVARKTTSAAQTVEISNSGTVVLPIKSIAIQGTSKSQFSQTNNCPAQVPVGGRCSVSVKFKPSSIGSKSASLQISVGGGALTTSVPLSGTGI